MGSLPRLLLVCLLAWALPLQSIAAATMRFCAPMHAAPAVHAQAHEHEAHAPAHDGLTAAAEMAAPGHADAATAGGHSCSACAACCAASALPAAALAVPVVDPAVEQASLTAPSYVGPDAAGLERPPRL